MILIDALIIIHHDRNNIIAEKVSQHCLSKEKDTPKRVTLSHQHSDGICLG